MERRRFSAENFLIFSQADDHHKDDIRARLAPALQRPERIGHGKSVLSPSNPPHAVTPILTHVVSVEQSCVLWQTTAPEEAVRLER